jgi:hypothetical protein
MISAIVAFAILGICVLVADYGHPFTAPVGVVEIGPITPVTMLDEIVVIAMR